MSINEWLNLAEAVGIALAKTGRTFSVDDLRELIEPPPTPHIQGTAFEWLADSGVIVPVGEIRSARGYWITLWQGAEFVSKKTKKKAA